MQKNNNKIYVDSLFSQYTVPLVLNSPCLRLGEIDTETD